MVQLYQLVQLFGHFYGGTIVESFNSLAGGTVHEKMYGT